MTRILPLAAVALSLAAPALAEGPPIYATYHVDNGSLPPEHAWATNVTILGDGTVTLEHCTGYATEGPDCQTRRGHAFRAGMQVIFYAAVESGLAASPAAVNPDPPIGGVGVSGSVTLDGITITLPRNPAPEDAGRVARVLQAISMSIPPELLDPGTD
jgi:hypothetical protein